MDELQFAPSRHDAARRRLPTGAHRLGGRVFEHGRALYPYAGAVYPPGTLTIASRRQSAPAGSGWRAAAPATSVTGDGAACTTFDTCPVLIPSPPARRQPWRPRSSHSWPWRSTTAPACTAAAHASDRSPRVGPNPPCGPRRSASARTNRCRRHLHRAGSEATRWAATLRPWRLQHRRLAVVGVFAEDHSASRDVAAIFEVGGGGGT